MEQDNSPYATPKSAVELSSQELIEVVPVGNWLRLANYLIDLTGMLLTIFISVVLAALIFGEEILDNMERIPDSIFGLVGVLIYYFPLEAATGRTLGKLVTGTKIVSDQGLKPSALQILGRTFSRMVPFEPLSFFGMQDGGWHDRWSKTYVVKCR